MRLTIVFMKEFTSKYRERRNYREKKEKCSKSAMMSIAVSELRLHDAAADTFTEEVHRYKSSWGHFALHLDYLTKRMSGKEDEDRKRECKERVGE